MSDNLLKSAELGRVWTKFEMEPFDTPFNPGIQMKKEFVALQAGEKEKGSFFSFSHLGNEYDQKEDAPDILEKAQEKALLVEQEAYERGFSQGEKDGFELGEKKALKVAENLENLLVEIGNLKENIVSRHEEELLELVFAISRKIIRHQLDVDETVVREVTLEALRLATQRSKVVFRVNNEDFDFVERLRPDFFKKFEEAKSITIMSDSSISRGGCVLETPYGDIDARIETQLEKIHQALSNCLNGNE